MLKTIFGIMFAVVSLQANALLIDASTFDSAIDGCTGPTACWTKEQTELSVYDNPDADDVEAILGYQGDLFGLYKSNVGGIDEYTYADSYITAYSDEVDDPANGVIAYHGGDSIECGDCYLLVKDGNHTPGWYLFDINDWDGTELLILTNFWEEEGSISHVSIYGTEVVSVDEPHIGFLLGAGAIGIGIVRRKRKKNV